ncbi:MAG: SDR family oxidoreductase [Anaerolineales bacterium]|jgi:3-oxoacyl-[acyl-carrier protein] reductase|nr:SDR family oxidoreductase [Anaerolineales bacterium]
MKRLNQKTAIVTGGGTGIGRGIALALAQEGARLVLCGRRLERIQSVASEVQAMGGEALAVQADVSHEQDVARLTQAAIETYGRVDILVNNAAVFEEGELHALSIESWDRVMAVNLRGAYLCIRQVLPLMRAQRSGQILNISSESGIEYYRGDGAYGLSKHALNDLGEYVQRENQDFNIRVNTICPGMVVTEMTKGSPGLNEEKCLYPEDIADLAIWLLTRRENIKIGTPILIQTMLNPWE